MRHDLLIADIHVSVFVPRRLPAHQLDAIYRTVNARRRLAELRQAVAGVFRRHTALKPIRFTVGH